MPPAAAPIDHETRLHDFIAGYPRLFVLTGAGVSTASGIPDYRDCNGDWKRLPPVQYRDFVEDPATRRRYWARSLVGWQAFAEAAPNGAHRALAALERAGRVAALVTQNVDSLHQRAGSRAVVDLHGRLAVVVCLGCGRRRSRGAFQHALARRNPEFDGHRAARAPDGDAELDGIDFSSFVVPACTACGGTLKPDVVFFGEGVPRPRVERALGALRSASALLVVGSSLTVYSGFRFCVEAARLGMPIVAINRGRTRADALLELKVDGDCGAVLERLSAVFAASQMKPPGQSGSSS